MLSVPGLSRRQGKGGEFCHGRPGAFSGYPPRRPRPAAPALVGGDSETGRRRRGDFGRLTQELGARLKDSRRRAVGSAVSEANQRGSDGVAGGSARREHARRRASREQRVRERHPVIGGALLALVGEPEHERSWLRGAEGEERAARELERRVAGKVVLLHDRRLSGRANIDHLAIAPSGVWVIDTKRYRGRVEVKRPLLGRLSRNINCTSEAQPSGSLLSISAIADVRR